MAPSSFRAAWQLFSAEAESSKTTTTTGVGKRREATVSFDWDKRVVLAITHLLQQQNDALATTQELEAAKALSKALLVSLVRKLGSSAGDLPRVKILTVDLRPTLRTLVIYGQVFYLRFFFPFQASPMVARDWVEGGGGLAHWLRHVEDDVELVLKSAALILRPQYILVAHLLLCFPTACLLGELYRKWYHVAEYAYLQDILSERSPTAMKEYEKMLWWLQPAIPAEQAPAFRQHLLSKDLSPTMSQGRSLPVHLWREDAVFRQFCLCRLPLHDDLSFVERHLCRWDSDALVAGGILLKQGFPSSALRLLTSPPDDGVRAGSRDSHHDSNHGSNRECDDKGDVENGKDAEENDEYKVDTDKYVDKEDKHVDKEDWEGEKVNTRSKRYELAAIICQHLQRPEEAAGWLVRALQCLDSSVISCLHECSPQGSRLAGLSRRLLHVLLHWQPLENRHKHDNEIDDVKVEDSIKQLLAPLPPMVKERFLLPLMLGRLGDGRVRAWGRRLFAPEPWQPLWTCAGWLLDDPRDLPPMQGDIEGYAREGRIWRHLLDFIARNGDDDRHADNYEGRHPLGCFFRDVLDECRQIRGAEYTLGFDCTQSWTNNHRAIMHYLRDVSRMIQDASFPKSLAKLQSKVHALERLGDLHALRQRPGDGHWARKYYRTALHNIPTYSDANRCIMHIACRETATSPSKASAEQGPQKRHAKWPWLQADLDRLGSKLSSPGTSPVGTFKVESWQQALRSGSWRLLEQHIDVDCPDRALLLGLLYHFCLMVSPSVAEEEVGADLDHAVRNRGGQVLNDLDMVLIAAVQGRLITFIDGKLSSHMVGEQVDAWNDLVADFGQLVLCNRQSVSKLATSSASADDTSRRQWWRQRQQLDDQLGSFIRDRLQKLLPHDSDEEEEDLFMSTMTQRRRNLAVDLRLQLLPWEACFPRDDCVRLWSSDRLNGTRCGELMGQGGHRRITYMLNPQGDLVHTEATFAPMLRDKARFHGVIGRTFQDKAEFQTLCLHAPSTPVHYGHDDDRDKDGKECDDGKDDMENELFIYFGHSGPTPILDPPTITADDALSNDRHTGCREHYAPAWLLGCSSAILHSQSDTHGDLQAVDVEVEESPVQAWLNRGAKYVLGTLWDVTDRDIDRFTVRFGGSSVFSNSVEQIAYDQWPRLLREARNECLLRHANGCAPILYQLVDPSASPIHPSLADSCSAQVPD